MDGQKIYNDLLANNTETLNILMTSGSVTYCRDDLLSIDCAVFEKIDDQKLRIRYRYDSTAFIPEWANAAFKYIQTHYSTNEHYITPVSLDPGDSLVMDNLRVAQSETAEHSFIEYTCGIHAQSSQSLLNAHKQFDSALEAL